jgi:hypothetical protein
MEASMRLPLDARDGIGGHYGYVTDVTGRWTICPTPWGAAGTAGTRRVRSRMR